MYKKLTSFAARLLARLLLRVSDFVQAEKIKLLCKSGKAVIDSTFHLGEGSNFVIEGIYDSLIIEEKVQTKNYCNFLLYSGSSLVIRKNVFFNNYCSVNCLGTVIIGENTLFGEGVKIYDHNHEYHYENERLIVEQKKFSIGKVIIGKNCWIGSNVTILKDVEIGDNVIIGANNLIYKSIPPNVVVKAKTEQIINQE